MTFISHLTGGDRETRPHVPEQRAAPVALRDPGPARARRQEVLRQVLRRLHRPHQYSAAAVYTHEGENVLIF